MCLHYIHAMCDFLYRLLAMNWGKAVWRPRGDGTKIVQSSHRNCTEPVASVRGQHRDSTVAVQFCVLDSQGCNNSLLPSPFLPYLQSQVCHSEPEW